MGKNFFYFAKNFLPPQQNLPLHSQFGTRWQFYKLLFYLPITLYFYYIISTISNSILSITILTYPSISTYWYALSGLKTKYPTPIRIPITMSAGIHHNFLIISFFHIFHINFNLFMRPPVLPGVQPRSPPFFYLQIYYNIFYKINQFLQPPSRLTKEKF